MKNKLIPYHSLEAIGTLLLAVRGSSIDLINSSDASVISTWVCLPVHLLQNDQLPEEELHPAKKIRLMQSENTEENNIPKKSDKYQNYLCWETPIITSLTSTANGKYVVIATGVDKSIRVLEVIGTDRSCKLVQLSQRLMPKRTSALIITNDDSTIISADKFGDVYSLPLLYSSPLPFEEPVTSALEQTMKPFIPAANELTIHSQRNKKTLENQRKQKSQSSQKAELKFDHKLLLGHVSMLTDLKLAIVSGRSYIITSDRDEHIRISRGIPQTHIIENFCLGHSEFVSRMCIPESKSELLISGGGDDDLFVWHWKSGSVLSRINLRDQVNIFRRKLFRVKEDIDEFDTQVKFAISGIIHIPGVVDSKPFDMIVITCESLPALFTFVLLPENTLQFIETIWTSGNVLDMCVIHDQETKSRSLLVSIDNINEPGSTLEIRKADCPDLTPLYQYKLRCGHLIGSPVAVEISMNETVQSIHNLPVELKDLLYGIEDLRKR